MANFSKMLDDLGRIFERGRRLAKSVIPTAKRRVVRRMEE
jgi:hypothetical protein